MTKSKLHKISYYMDGHKKVEYCSTCGVEDMELYLSDCSGEYRSWPSNAKQLKATMEIIEKYPIIHVDKLDKKA